MSFANQDCRTLEYISSLVSLLSNKRGTKADFFEVREKGVCKRRGEKKREKVRSEREEARWLASIHWTRLRSRAASIDTTRVIVPPKGVCVAVIATVHHFLTSSVKLLYLYFLVFSLQFNNWIYSTHCVECYRKGIQMSKWFIFVINIQVLLSLMLKCILT